MDRKLLFTLLLGFWCTGALAQPHDLVAASGASFHNSSGYLSFSIGECVISTHASPGAILTQGFHQTRLRTGVPVVSQPEIQMSVFPNPVKDHLFLQIGDPQGFQYMLYDILGEMVERGEVLGEQTSIDFSSLAPAMYILKVTDKKKESRLFQIVKH
ncbi:MAG: T9SS type A sorting domain-containing protein [Bacteroidales bacterium]|nr:T9SS type A sorting domain-containing protein [Bacteroidales bacterium]